MTLEIEPEELPILKLAVGARVTILDGLMRRAAKREQHKYSLQRQKAADLFAKIVALEVQ